MLIFVLFFIINAVFHIVLPTKNLFAGNGLVTYSRTILHDRIIEMNCTTYDDCYNLLCSYLYEPVYLVIIDPNDWNGACDNLEADSRLLLAQLDVYKGNIPYKSLKISTVGQASKLLCELKKDELCNNGKFHYRIEYTIYKCNLTI